MRILVLSGATFVAFALTLAGQAPAGAQLAKLTEIHLTDKLAARPGGGPEAIASDGTYIWVADGSSIWVANSGSSTLTRLDRATGAVIATYASGRGPFGVAFDGRNVWTANVGGSSVSTTLLAQ